MPSRLAAGVLQVSQAGVNLSHTWRTHAPPGSAGPGWPTLVADLAPLQLPLTPPASVWAGGSQIIRACMLRAPLGAPLPYSSPHRPGLPRSCHPVARPDLLWPSLPRPGVPRPDLPRRICREAGSARPDLPRPHPPRPDLPWPDLPPRRPPRPDLPRRPPHSSSSAPLGGSECSPKSPLRARASKRSACSSTLWRAASMASTCADTSCCGRLWVRAWSR